MNMSIIEHNKRVRGIYKEIYSNDLKESILINRNYESFQIQINEESNSIIATRNIEKYTLDIENRELNGEFIVMLYDNYKFIGNCKNNLLDGIQRIYKGDECISEFNMTGGRVEKRSSTIEEIRKNVIRVKLPEKSSNFER